MSSFYDLDGDADLTSNPCDKLGTREQPSHPQPGYLPSPKLARRSRLEEPNYTLQLTKLPSSSRSPQSFQYEPNRTPRPASDILGDMEQHGPRPDLPADENVRPPTTGESNSSARKTGKKRKSDEETDEDDETQKAKRKRDLVRNRLAASKCRAKKKEETRQTEEKARRLQTENAHLRAWVGQLQEEKLHLIDQILALSDSFDTRICGFLNQWAYPLAC